METVLPWQKDAPKPSRKRWIYLAVAIVTVAFMIWGINQGPPLGPASFTGSKDVAGEDVIDDEPARERAAGVGDLAEIRAFEQLHDDERKSVLAGVDVDHAGDVLRLELRCAPRLEEQTRPNLDRTLEELGLAQGDEIVVTDHALAGVPFRFRLKFEPADKAGP